MTKDDSKDSQKDSPAGEIRIATIEQVLLARFEAIAVLVEQIERQVAMLLEIAKKEEEK